MDVLPFLPVPPGTENQIVLDLRTPQSQEDVAVPGGIRWIGLGPVLLLQCGLAFAWWFGLPVPWHVMRKAFVR